MTKTDPKHAGRGTDALNDILGHATGHSTRESERLYLYSRCWRERSCDGPWRWYRTDWKPVACYTLHDAVALQRSLDQRKRS